MSICLMVTSVRNYDDVNLLDGDIISYIVMSYCSRPVYCIMMLIRCPTPELIAVNVSEPLRVSSEAPRVNGFY